MKGDASCPRAQDHEGNEENPRLLCHTEPTGHETVHRPLDATPHAHHFPILPTRIVSFVEGVKVTTAQSHNSMPKCLFGLVDLPATLVIQEHDKRIWLFILIPGAKSSRPIVGMPPQST